MKKLMALCLSLLMVLSMCSFTVMAEDEATFEDISNEPATFVTADLTLGGHTITSSKENVINSETGAVTRPLVGDETVTLSIDGGTSFDVIVKDQTVEPIVNHGYSTDGIVTDYGWTISGYSTAADNIVSDGELHVVMDASGTSKRTYLNMYPEVPSDGIVRAAFDINDITNISGKALTDANGDPLYKTDGATQQTTSAGIDFALYFDVTLDDGTVVKEAIKDYRIARITTAITTGAKTSNQGINFPSGKIDFKYDSTTGDIWVLKNTGAFQLLNTNIINLYTPAEGLSVESVSLNHITLLSAGDWYVGDFDIDSFSIYSEVDAEEFIGTLDADDRVAYYKDLIQNTGITADGSLIGVRSDLTLMQSPSEAADTTISWASSNPAVITDAGAVTLVDSVRPADVTMTATITADDVTDTVVFPLQVAQAGTTSIFKNDFESETTITNTSQVEDDAAHGTVINLKQEATGKKTTGMISQENVTYYDRVLVSADIKYTQGAGKAQFNVYGIQGAEAFVVELDYYNKLINLGSSHSYMQTGGTLFEGTTTTSTTNADKAWLSFPMPDSVAEKEGEWVNYVFDINILSQTYYVYADGQLINESPVVRQNAWKTNTDNARALRGYGCLLTGSGDMYVDNISWCKFDDADAVEVNAALNAAIMLQAAEHVHPVITSSELLTKTISKSWVKASSAYASYFELDTSDTTNNPGRYTIQTDGPTISYEVNGDTVESLDVSSPKEIELTITATSADGTISESKTLRKQVAPLGIRGLAYSNTALNGIWVSGELSEALDEKLVIAQYDGNKLVKVKVMTFDEDGKTFNDDGTTVKTGYDADVSIMKLSGIQNPSSTDTTTKVKVMILDGNGITPLAFADELTD